jgi:hypothetical protein
MPSGIPAAAVGGHSQAGTSTGFRRRWPCSRLGPWNGNGQPLAPGGPKLQDIGPVILGAIYHDAILAGQRHRSLPQSLFSHPTSSRRRQDSALRLVDSHRHLTTAQVSLRFDTIPSSPILQACANTIGASASMCSLNFRPGGSLSPANWKPGTPTVGSCARGAHRTPPWWGPRRGSNPRGCRGGENLRGQLRPKML